MIKIYVIDNYCTFIVADQFKKCLLFPHQHTQRNPGGHSMNFQAKV